MEGSEIVAWRKGHKPPIKQLELIGYYERYHGFPIQQAQLSHWEQGTLRMSRASDRLLRQVMDWVDEQRANAAAPDHQHAASDSPTGAGT